jgi:hypothetical protein
VRPCLARRACAIFLSIYACVGVVGAYTSHYGGHLRAYPLLCHYGTARACWPNPMPFLVGTTRGPRHESECSLSSRNAWLHKIQIKYTLGAGPLNDEGHAANKSKEGQQASENGSRRRFPRSPVRGCGGSGWGGCLGWAPPPGH